MGIVNPKLLVVILEDLQDEIIRWSSAAGETMVIADYTQVSTEEQLDRQQHRARIIKERASNDVDMALNTHQATENLIDELREVQGTAQQTVQDTTTALSVAQKALIHWNAELAHAQAWLKRAEERVRLAEIELQRAMAALQQAKIAYDRAVSAYNACVNYRDNEGRRRDCSGERARVSQTEAAVRRAVDEVEIAKAELEAALAERERAIRRVNCCLKAVEFSTAAVNVATTACKYAVDGLNVIERGQESGDVALRFSGQAKREAQEEDEEADEALIHIRTAADLVNDAHNYLRTAERSEESAQRLRISVNTELDHRVGLLYEMNRPTLESVGGSGSAGISSFTAHTSVGATLYQVEGGSSRASDMVEKMMQNKGTVDLSTPAAWGKFSHNAIQDYIYDRDQNAELEKSVRVVRENGTFRRGRIDALTKDVILEIKTHDLDRFSEGQLMRNLDKFARQLEGYQNSPDLSVQPGMTIFLEKTPATPGRKKQVESFFAGRGISIVWGVS